jgi:hypothetical protein
MIAIKSQDRQSLSAQDQRIGPHIKEVAPMSGLRLFLTAIAVAAIMNSSAAIAQTSPQPSTATQVEKWTTKQWEAAKKEWSKDKKKWADCRKQSRDQKLEGRKSWSFLYKCMTS